MFVLCPLNISLVYLQITILKETGVILFIHIPHGVCNYNYKLDCTTNTHTFYSRPPPGMKNKTDRIYCFVLQFLETR